MSPAPETVVAEPVAAAAGVVDAAAPPSIFDRLGGEAAVEKAVDVFYERIVADPQLAPFFEGVDMRTQRRKQQAFMTYAFGGATGYTGRDLAAAHRRLIRDKGLKEEHFDMVAGHLAGTLQLLGIGADLVDEVIALVATTKPVIFERV
ncbi:hypothetical protein CHLRE_14g615350v5 [Chlamydomonas reinhardtii]|uniref:Truncated hemoglobin 2 n=1 Tax=Chlamydomonas reinhardtii TaxID=3055 RepID=A8JAR3_CHLRE|nr:uncharacterized protein CHLRE_14g615350v5 [Chlamydomonas reinhardtii]AGM75735.1 truncated hemoglobin 2 [Chlamydomonas reinhardtii]PNW73012.1 hypothetical protein CHLRE_14g615350v5 [Chlamydomonas reinhardtii]|eukprot:XP_001699004.1 predicted protein [Chlamydomonas reinhardtii]